MITAQELYNSKKRSLHDALGYLHSGDAIISGLGASEPVELLKNVHKIGEHGIKGCDVTSSLPVFSYEYIANPAYAEVVASNGWFFSAAQRAAAKSGVANVSHVPQRLHNAVLRRLYALREDKRRAVLFASCSPMDEHGHLSLSLSVTYERVLVDEGAVVIVEVNPQMPRTFGDSTIHISEIDVLVEVDYPAFALPHVPFNEKDSSIAGFISERIGDGSTIQLGIGGVPNALAVGLKTKKHLGIHTEMLTDNMVDLFECGAADNSMKTLCRHKTVGTFAMGSQRLYDFIDNNASVLMKNGTWTNDPNVVGQNYKMQSINTAIEVDLFGQCASEAIGPIQFSGSGGQADTAIGAQRSDGGHSFICLYSTASVKNKEGERQTVSKIVPMLKEGSVVTLGRNDVDYVVTEFGIVNLRGRNLKERAERLISIAHPDFREELRYYVKQHPEIY